MSSSLSHALLRFAIKAVLCIYKITLITLSNVVHELDATNFIKVDVKQHDVLYVACDSVQS